MDEKVRERARSQDRTTIVSVTQHAKIDTIGNGPGTDREPSLLALLGCHVVLFPSFRPLPTVGRRALV
jgi:hypothetical protein